MATDPNSIIFGRRHPDLKAKLDVWQLIHDSYHGGSNYQDGGYLYQHAKESKDSFNTRKKRAVYFNQIQPLADLLAGFLFIKPPSRKNVGPASHLLESATNKGKSMNEFMKIVITHSLLFTCGVLVDSPTFDPEVIKTEKDRIDNNLQSFCTLYLPFQIRDFHIAEDGLLDWIILDNSFYDNSDIMREGVNRTVYRVWTRSYYQDFEIVNTDKSKTQEATIVVGEENPHPIGYIPFKFSNWKDDNSDCIAESVFEDPAMISKLIYNKLSEMDEMIASGSFRVLMYPTKNGKIPPELIAGGIGALSAIPFDATSGKAPFFDGAKLEDVAPFLKAIEFYISEILKKIGLDTDETKDYVKSGLAKKIDFQKVRTLLVSGSMSLMELEKWVFKTAAKWVRKDAKAEIDYVTQYAEEDIQIRVNALTELLVHPFKKLRTAVTGLLVKTLLTGELPQKVLDEIYDEIENDITVEGEEDKPDVNKLAAEERAAVNSINNNTTDEQAVE